jgi:predicted transglutaminase-like cysteine proteinase
MSLYQVNIVEQNKRSLHQKHCPLDVRNFYVNPKNAELLAVLELAAKPSDNDLAKVTKIYDWVQTNISYLEDIDVDFWQMPFETLALRTADCEDGSILLANLLVAAGIKKSKVGIAIVKKNGQWHACVLWNKQVLDWTNRSVSFQVMPATWKPWYVWTADKAYACEEAATEQGHSVAELKEAVTKKQTRNALIATVTVLTLLIAGTEYIPTIFPPTGPVGLLSSQRTYTVMVEDGYLRHSNSTSYLDTRNDRVAATSPFNTTAYYRVGQRLSGTYYIQRTYIMFNTTADPVPDTAYHLNVTLQLWWHKQYMTNPTPDFNVTITRYASDSAWPHIPIVRDDYNLTSYGNDSNEAGYLDTTNLLTEQYNNVTFNDLGVSWFNKNGITKFCLRSSLDQNATAPTVDTEYVDFGAQENATAIPRLIVGYEIDPTASYNFKQLRDPYQRPVVYAQGRVWVAFSNGTGSADSFLLLTSSANGLNWSDSTVLGLIGSTMGESRSLAYDQINNYIHFVFEDHVNNDICYRRGKPYPNGTINLNDTVIVFDGNSSNAVSMPSIGLDSSGYPWVFFQDIQSTDINGLIYKSNVNNGSFFIQAGFPHNLTQAWNQGALGARAVILKLLNNKIGVIYQKATDYVYYDAWNGTIWTTTNETASLSPSSDGDFLCGVSILDDVHLTYETVTPANISYRKRISSSGWEAQETNVVPNCATYQGAPMNWDKSKDSLRTFWVNSTTGQVFYRERLKNGTWLTSVNWFNSTETLQSERTNNVNYEANAGENITFVYEVGTASPYHFRYAGITLNGTALSMGWNNVTILASDVGHTLSQINASLCADNINYTFIILVNTTAHYPFEREFGGFDTAIINSITEELDILCTEVGTWQRTYS